jgi:hypothetical protein
MQRNFGRDITDGTNRIYFTNRAIMKMSDIIGIPIILESSSPIGIIGIPIILDIISI